MSYRPEGWPKCPCDDCPDKIIDDYGYFCNIVCQKRTHWICREAGADAVLESLFWMAQKSPTGVFTINSKEVHIYFKESSCE